MGGRGSTTTSTSPTSPNPGPTVAPSAPSSTTSSPTPLTSTPSRSTLQGQTEELRSGFHDWGEVCWGARLPHSGGHVRYGGGEEDRPQDDLLLCAGGVQNVQRALVARPAFKNFSFFIPRSQVKAVVRWSGFLRKLAQSSSRIRRA